MMAAVIGFFIGLFVGGMLVNESVSTDCKRGMIKADGVFYRTSQACPEKKESGQ